MTLWKSTLFLAVLGVFTVAFMVSLSLLGLNTDRTGGSVPEPEETEIVEPGDVDEDEPTTPEAADGESQAEEGTDSAGEGQGGDTGGETEGDDDESDADTSLRFELGAAPGLPL